MITSENQEDFLLLSGIQHIAFCPRQWALIHLEQVWAENVHTIDGKHFHEKVDNITADETRKGIRTVRAMPIVTHQLRLRGIADMVEFHLSSEKDLPFVCRIKKFSGWYCVVPIEYKSSSPKKDDRDAVQLCAQGIALEEMLGVKIARGFLFYGKTRRRQEIIFDTTLREKTFALVEQMYILARNGKTPLAEKSKKCSLCSLIEFCQPDLVAKSSSVEKYIKKYTCEMIE